MAVSVENARIVEMLKKTYCFYRQKYVVMKKEYTKTVGHYFTDQVIESHLNGNYALAVFAGEKVTRFLSVDVDEGGKKTARMVMDAFERMGIPRERIYISTSGKKGYHVDIFFNPWIYNEKAKNLYELMIWQTQLNPKKVEYRPTATQAIKLPLGVHQGTGNRCWFLDRETLKPIERMDYLDEILPISSEAVLEILRVWNKKRWNELYADMICEGTGADESISKEICFNQEYYDSKRITESGTRHQVMVEIACDLRHYGANEFQIAKALRGFYYRQDPLYMETTEDEVMEDIREIARWAAESVPIIRYRRSPTDVHAKTITYDKYDVYMILQGPTSAARKVALLIYAYCKMFGAAHISYSTMADTVGCRVATVETAVRKLIEKKIIHRQSGGCHYENGRLVKKANTYFIPKADVYVGPDIADIVAETYETGEKLNDGKFGEYYGKVLTAICKPEYLAKYLTKPELEDVLKVGKN